MAARATQWKLEERSLPDILARSLSGAPLRCAAFPAGCDCCQPAPLGRTYRGFSCSVTRAEWLALGPQDWAVVSVLDRGSEVKQAPNDDTELRKGSLIVFLCPATARVSGKPWAAADKKVVDATTTHGKLSEGVRLQLDASSGAEFRVLRGATLLAKDADHCIFEYEPLDRISHNFGKVSEYAGSMGQVDFLWFRDEAVTPKRQLGGRSGGLDVSGRFGIKVLGICRFKKAATWNEELAVDVTWLPPPDFEVEPGDVAIITPSTSGSLWAVGATVFKGFARCTPASPAPERVFCQFPQSPGGMDGRYDRLPPGTPVEYYSATYGGWAPAIVQGFDEQAGTYVLDIQPCAQVSKVRLPAQGGHGLARHEVQQTAPQLPLPTRHFGSALPTHVGGLPQSPYSGRSPGTRIPGVVGTQDLHADLDTMANLVTRQRLNAADSPQTVTASPGARQEMERAKQRLVEATLLRDAAKRAMSAAWFYSPSKKEELANAEQAVLQAQQEVERWSILAESQPAAHTPPPMPQASSPVTNPQLNYWPGTGDLGYPQGPAPTKHGIGMAPPAATKVLHPQHGMGMPPTSPNMGVPPTAPRFERPFSAATREEQERMIAHLVHMGFQRHQAEQAFKRCSTVQAAAQWLAERA
mmetsp:Transcript_101238/g.292754  ORF Transcript_101238/g.292754 Transcript_101238/m.292754 type:complete len:639 (-) Transcript_101238:80-1996(-)